MITQELTGWLQEQDSSSLYKAVNEIVIRGKQKRSVSLCQKRQISSKSNLMDRNKSQYLQPTSKIQELKKVMEFLQYNEQHKYDTHRFFDKNDPKFKPEWQQEHHQKMEQYRNNINQVTQKQQQQSGTQLHSDRSLKRQKPPLLKPRLKTDQENQQNFLNIQRTILANQSIHSKPPMHRISSMQMPKLDRNHVQLIIDKHKENVQQFLPRRLI